MMESKKECIVAINQYDFGSTGNVARDILGSLQKQGHEVYLACSEFRKKDDLIFWISKNRLRFYFNKILCRLSGSDGFHNKKDTKKLIKFLKEKKITKLILNNLHGCYINLELLFKFIKEEKIKTTWILHDCWSFTGKCPYFTFNKCDKWKKSCKKCCDLKTYPRAYLFDKTEKMYNKKKQIFEGIEKYVTLVSPSKWLGSFIKDSILKECKIQVINNGINYNAQTKFEIIEKYHNINDKIILFAAGMPMGFRKGFDFINRLADELDSSKYLILVAGIEKDTKVSENIVNLGLIKDRETMNSYYKIADYFINPTLEDNFPTTNMESVFMGTPVITFDGTGSPESIPDGCGFVVKQNNYDELKSLVLSLKKKTRKDIQKCIDSASVFNKEIMISKYIEIL